MRFAGIKNHLWLPGRIVTMVALLLVLSAGLLAYAHAASAAGSGGIYNGQRGESFDNGWKFAIGDYAKAVQSDFDDSMWKSVDLPHDWSIEQNFNQYAKVGSEQGFLDGGIGWYRKTFYLPQTASGQSISVQFDGVYMNSEVWINGTKLGVRPYGYSTFSYDLTPYLHYGGTANVIAVKVDNSAQRNSRFYSGSGIYRHVWMTFTNPVHVDYSGTYIRTLAASASTASLASDTVVANDSGSAQSVIVKSSLLNDAGTVVASVSSAAVPVAAGGKSTVQQTISVANPKLWSPSAPNLYKMLTEVIVGGATFDTYRTTVGIRTFGFDANNGFSINGQSMKINGVNMHHDLGSLGSAISDRALERQLQTLKQMGANAIRTSHNPPAPELLDLADRLGFVVMAEAFDAWETAKVPYDYHLYFDNWAKQDLQDFVRRDRNHASVVMWSIGNEIPEQNSVAGRTIAANLIGWIHELDTTRPITQGINSYPQNGDLYDVVGINYATATNARSYSQVHQDHPAWKLIGSETSSAVRSRGVYFFPPANTPTADRQESSYDNTVVSWGQSAENSWKLTNSASYIAGEFVWTGFDYIGEPTPNNSWPSKNSYFGAVDTSGFPKDIFYFYRSKWGRDLGPMVHLVPSNWNWTAGQTIPVWAYTNADSVELFINGSSLGAKTMSADTVGHLEWSVPFEAGTLRAEARINGAIVAVDEVKTAGAPARIVLKPDRTTITADGKDLTFIEADIVDANGVLVPTANNAVAFSVLGEGAIVGVDNGDSTDIEPFKGKERKAFSGKALAIVRTNGSPGIIKISAQSVGLQSASVTVNAIAPAATPAPVVTLAPDPANLAFGKTATADSVQAGHPANAANDGAAGTRWTANDGNANHWWQVDLGAAYSLGATEATWESDGNMYKYKIEVSKDNTNWTVAVDKTNNSSKDGTQRDVFPAVSARYVRLTVTGLTSGTWAAVREFKVFHHVDLIEPGAYYKLLNQGSGSALDVNAASTADGAAAIQWPDNSGLNQQWQFVDTGDGFFKIKSRNSGKLLDVTGASKTAGAAVIQWSDNGGANQQWKLVELNGGYYKLVNRNSGNVLDVGGASTANGAKTIQSTDAGSASQQWKIVRVQ